MSPTARNDACARWLLARKFATLHDVMQDLYRNRTAADRRTFAEDLQASATFAAWPEAVAVVAWWAGLVVEPPAGLLE